MTQDEKKEREIIGRKIKEKRQMLGMTQIELSIACGMDMKSISLIERGLEKAKPVTMDILAKALGVEIADIYRIKPEEITNISRDMLNAILDAPGETYEPRGLFIVLETIDGVKVYTAVRNLDGKAETEEFKNRRAATRWLLGHKVSEQCLYRPRKQIEAIEKIKRAGICME